MSNGEERDPWTTNPRVDEQRAGSRDPQWAEQQVERLLHASLVEQRRTRRWGIFFKALFIGYLFLVLGLLVYDGGAEDEAGDGRHTALVELHGVITEGGDASAERIASGLRRAFEHPATAAVILHVNSPGGSPVQSQLIYDEIRRLRERNPQTPLYAVIGDVGASGGYYAAAAADRIYAAPASIVGSIGVRMDSFGLVEAIDKLGIERRLMTAGENKALLDPFLPTDPEQVAHVERLLERVHRQFIDAVRNGRGDRLVDDERLFSGLIWTGEEGMDLGLIDAMGSRGSVARDVVGHDKIVDFTPKRAIWEQVVDRFGTAFGGVLATQLGVGALR